MLVCFVLAVSQSLPQPEFLEGGRKKRELDLLGLLIFALMLSFLLSLVDLGGRGTAMGSPTTISLLLLFAVSAVGFGLVEVFWAKQPILSPSLLRQAGVASCYLLQILLLCAQFSVSASSSSRLVLNVLVDCFQHCNIFCADRECVEFGSCTPCSAYIFW